MKINILKFLIIFCFLINPIKADDKIEFSKWLINFEIYARGEGVSESTLKNILPNIEFLPKVLIYDRRQPEFYEDTYTYIKKRTNFKKVIAGKLTYELNKDLIDSVEKEFGVEKELLLALMGIETNFGKYLGKMDILSSLATLSYDKRRSAFFTNELITLLKLIDKKIIDKKILFGSWAGAVGNFQFMPSTIKNYALDYNSNNIIELKETEDSFASAANYINKLGWSKNDVCFIKIDLKSDIPSEYLNTSAKKIHSHFKISKIKKYIENFDTFNLNDKTVAAIITPDKDIIPDSNNLSPAYLIFNNYELILKWNRSLRFALAVCTLKNKIKNEI